MEPAADSPLGRAGLLRYLWRISSAAVAVLVLVIGLAIVNNNLSLPRPSRANFVKELDHSLDASAGWAMDQFYAVDSDHTVATAEGSQLVSNAPLAHMVVDCAAMSGDPRLQKLAAKFTEATHRNPSLWGKEVDPNLADHPFSASEWAALEEYQHWIAHGVSPTAAPLTNAELANMFSPDKFRTGQATHQLFALYFYRKSNGDTLELRRIMEQVENRIAVEAALDFRVTDLYLQRISFLLAAGRPDLVKPRWVERALAAQQSDGGWHYTWHGWSPRPADYTFSYEHSIAHSTAQGMWLTYMLKYRYPDWIEKNYK